MVSITTDEATNGQTTGETRGSPSKTRLWSGRVISIVLVLFFLFDSIGKILKIDQSVEGSVKLGYPEGTIVGIGLTLLACTILYSIPRTAFFGAILLTGYMGGAIATQVRVEDASFIFAAAVGVLVWVGLFLRDDRMRPLLGK